jgi:LemA protein
MKIAHTILLAPALALTLGALDYSHERNRLLSERQAIDTEWARVDAALQKRATLMPALTDALQGQLPDQATTFQSLADAKSAITAAPTASAKIEAHNRISEALGRIFVAVETRPDVKNSESFKKVQLSLEGPENEVLRARSRYNGAIKRYNTDLSLFPTNAVARVAGLERVDAYFITEPARLASPTFPKLDRPTLIK